jgi:hypothetical protein
VDPFHRLYHWKIIQTFNNPHEFSKEAPELVVNQPTIPVGSGKNFEGALRLENYL